MCRLQEGVWGDFPFRQYRNMTAWNVPGMEPQMVWMCEAEGEMIILLVVTTNHDQQSIAGEIAVGTEHSLILLDRDLVVRFR